MQYCFTVCVAASSFAAGVTETGRGFANWAVNPTDPHVPARHNTPAAEATNAFDIQQSIGGTGRWRSDESTRYCGNFGGSAGAVVPSESTLASKRYAPGTA